MNNFDPMFNIPFCMHGRPLRGPQCPECEAMAIEDDLELTDRQPEDSADHTGRFCADCDTEMGPHDWCCPGCGGCL